MKNDRGLSVWLTRDRWGLVLDGLMLEISKPRIVRPLFVSLLLVTAAVGQPQSGIPAWPVGTSSYIRAQLDPSVNLVCPTAGDCTLRAIVPPGPQDPAGSVGPIEPMGSWRTSRRYGFGPLGPPGAQGSQGPPKSLCPGCPIPTPPNTAPGLCSAAPTGLPALAGVPGVSLPLLPQKCYQPPYPVTTSTVTVASGSASDLQAKLSAAVCGEQIIVPANVHYVGTFVYGPTNPLPFGWQTSTAFKTGQQFVDPAYHLQLVTVGGTSGSTVPAWNDSGGTTIDGRITWTDQGVLPQYCPTNPVLVVSSNIANLPQYQGISQSATPASVPTLECDANGCTTLSISDGVSGIYFAGIEFTLGPSATNVYPIVGMGGYTPVAYAVPSYVTFDRVLIHPAPCSPTAGDCAFVQAGLDLNATYATLMYSNIWGIINTGQDTNAVSTNNNTGPILIAANYLEASGENVFFSAQCGNWNTYSGTVTTSGNNVTWASGTQFTTSTTANSWVGAPMTINSVQYTIQAVNSPTGLTLTTSAGMKSSAVAYTVAFPGYLWPWGQPTCPAPADATIRLNHIKKQLNWRNNPVRYSGVVSTNGTAVNLISGSQFNPAWGNGGIYVVINGANYIVTKPSAATTLTLTTSAGTQANVPYYEGCIPSIPWGCWDVKNGFEIKQGQRILLDSNWFDTTFAEGQAGFFLWNCGISSNPAQVCNDITVTNNLFEHGPSVGSPFGWSGYGPQNTNTSRGLIRNNVAIDISGPTWGANGYVGSVQNTKYQTFDHNTFLNTTNTNPFSMIFADAPPHTNIGFTWTNSFQYGQPFANSDNAGQTMADWPKNGVPVTIGGVVNVGDYFGYSGGSPAYPPGMKSLSAPSCRTASKVYSTCWPLDWAMVGFSDFTCGGQGVGCASISNKLIGGLALAPTSPYHNAGTDGLDVGANVRAVIAAISSISW
jgi:hypothetical protein